MKCHQYTIRRVPPSVDRALRKKAAERRVSLNDVLLDALENEAGLKHARTHHELDFLIGTWVDDPEMERAFKAARTVDPKDWA